MDAVLSDTDPEAEQVQLDLLRRATPERRLRLALSLTRSVVALSRAAIARAMPHATDQELAVRFVELHYGPELAAELRTYLLAR